MQILLHRRRISLRNRLLLNALLVVFRSTLEFGLISVLTNRIIQLHSAAFGKRLTTRQAGVEKIYCRVWTAKCALYYEPEYAKNN